MNTDRSASGELTVPTRGERHTLTAEEGLLSHHVELNGKRLVAGKGGTLPAIVGAPVPAGKVVLPAASITFLAFANAGNVNCR